MKKKYIFLIALVGVFLLGIFRYIDLNSRFPKAPTQAYGLGEWMPTGKAEICAVEAKILKKPILCTNFNTASEIINNKHDGIIVDKNEEALYRGLKMYIDDLKLKEDILHNLNSENQYSSVSEIKKYLI